MSWNSTGALKAWHADALPHLDSRAYALTGLVSVGGGNDSPSASELSKHSWMHLSAVAPAFVMLSNLHMHCSDP